MKALLLLACIALSGCIAPSPKNAHVIIPAPPAKVRDSATLFLVSQGWRPVRADNLVMAFQKEGTGHDAFISDMGVPPKHELTLTLIDQTNSVRLIGHGARLIGRYGQQQNYSHLDIKPGTQWHLEAIKAATLGEPIPQLPQRTNAVPATMAKPARGQ